MTLRITTHSATGGEVVIIDGRLVAETVAELEQVVARQSGLVRLELAGLRSVDGAGLEALRTLRARGIPLIGAPPYLRFLLEHEARPRAPREPPSQPEKPRGGGATRRDASD